MSKGQSDPLPRMVMLLIPAKLMAYSVMLLYAAARFIPLSRRLQIGLRVPSVDSFQSNSPLLSATSVGDSVVQPD